MNWKFGAASLLNYLNLLQYSETSQLVVTWLVLMDWKHHGRGLSSDRKEENSFFLKPALAHSYPTRNFQCFAEQRDNEGEGNHLSLAFYTPLMRYPDWRLAVLRHMLLNAGFLRDWISTLKMEAICCPETSVQKKQLISQDYVTMEVWIS
jgi:hypothetical protein